MSHNKTIRLLFYGDGAVMVGYKTGFGRVSESILDRLAAYRYSDGTPLFEIHHVAVNYSPSQILHSSKGTPSEQSSIELVAQMRMAAAAKNYAIYETGTNMTKNLIGYEVDQRGFIDVQNVMQSVNPDVIVLYNDIYVINPLLHLITQHKHWIKNHPNILCYFPIDSEVNYKQIQFMEERSAALATFTEFGAEMVKKAVGKKPKIIPHAVDTTIFFPLDKDRRKSINKARAELINVFGENSPIAKLFESDSIVILQANRNTQRKQYGKTIDGFIRACLAIDKDKFELDRLKLLCLGSSDDYMGVDWKSLVEIFLQRYHLLDKFFNNHIFAFDVPYKTDLLMNLIYNACDIGINTSSGGGWELVNYEHAATGAAQIVPSNSCFIEQWEGKGYMIDCYEDIYDKEAIKKGVRVESVEKMIVKAVTDYDEREKRARLCYEEAVKRNWDDIAEDFKNFILENV